jgi:predicted nuclease with TOPRIM domain
MNTVQVPRSIEKIRGPDSGRWEDKWRKFRREFCDQYARAERFKLPLGKARKVLYILGYDNVKRELKNGLIR